VGVNERDEVAGTGGQALLQGGGVEGEDGIEKFAEEKRPR
jgi:hypothetical protein